jgi:hypothetical protein
MHTLSGGGIQLMDLGAYVLGTLPSPDGDATPYSILSGNCCRQLLPAVRAVIRSAFWRWSAFWTGGASLLRRGPGARDLPSPAACDCADIFLLEAQHRTRPVEKIARKSDYESDRLICLGVMFMLRSIN